MKYCKKCGEIIESGDSYCIFCGTPVSGQNNFSQRQNPPLGASWNQMETHQTGKKKTGIIIGVATALIVVLVIVFFSGSSFGSPERKIVGEWYNTEYNTCFDDTKMLAYDYNGMSSEYKYTITSQNEFGQIFLEKLTFTKDGIYEMYDGQDTIRGFYSLTEDGDAIIFDDDYDKYFTITVSGQSLTMEGSDSFYSLVSDKPEFEEDELVGFWVQSDEMEPGEDGFTNNIGICKDGELLIYGEDVGSYWIEGDKFSHSFSPYDGSEVYTNTYTYEVNGDQLTLTFDPEDEDNAYYYSDYLEYSQNEIDEMETTVMHFEKY